MTSPAETEEEEFGRLSRFSSRRRGAVFLTFINVTNHIFTNALTAHTWHYIVLTWDSSQNSVTGYFDGVQVFNESQPRNQWPQNFSNVQVGTGWYSRYWKGSVDELLFLNSSVSSADVATLYHSGNGFYGVPSSISSSNVIAGYHFDDGTGANAADFSENGHMGVFSGTASWVSGHAASGTGSIIDNASLVFNRSDSVTSSTVLSGTGSLTKLGTGTLTLTGTNTYSGGTTISAGTLQLGDGSTNGMVAGNIADNAVLIVDNGSVQSYSGIISGTGSLTKIGTGTLTLAGNNTYTGGTTISGGTLTLSTANAIGTSGTIAFSGGALQYTSVNTTDYSSRFSTAANQAYSIKRMARR